jgi:ABC-2 type transport system permease protein
VSGAVFRTMLLGLVRDRGALAMSFVLPAVFFLIFAVIFAGAGGEELRLTVAIADEVRSEASARLLRALEMDDSLDRVGGESADAAQVRELVRRGGADVGLVVRAGAEPLESPGGFGPAPLLVVSDPIRGVAASMLAGRVQKAYFSALPDAALKNVVELLEDEFLELTDEQRDDVEVGLADIGDEAREALRDGRSSAWGFDDLLEREDVAGPTGARNNVAYYAGAVAVLFLLFSAVHGAVSLLEERDAGILDRVLAGPGRATVLIHGKFLFLLVQGCVQIGVIFLIAWWAYGIDLPGRLAPWAVTTVAASAAAAGLALVLTAACRTRRQAQTLANVAILVVSALGGSMVPRFLMPDLLQDLGWLTPNTWAIEAYTAVFWRNAPMSELWIPWTALAAAGLVGLLAARRLARRLETL